MKAEFDFETRSACDIKKCGAAAYAEHPSTEVICCSIKVDGGPSRIWLPDWVLGLFTRAHMEGEFTDPYVTFEPLSDEELFCIFEEADELESHNNFFEHAVWLYCCTKKYDWPKPPVEKFRCSLAKCSYHALPRTLEQACQALGVPIQKDMAGHALMLKLCRPRKPVKAEIIGLREQGFIVDEQTKEVFNGQTGEQVYLWHELPEQFEALIRYCLNDTDAEHALSSALPDLPESELRIWQLDQKINMRGIAADIPAAKRFVEEIGKLETRLLAETQQVTDGAVGSPKQVAAALRWLAEQGVNLPDLTKNTVAGALKDENCSPAVRHLLELRQQLGRASTAKYQAIINAANEDGRIRGTLLYHGCSTGRWSAKGPQFQNIPRGYFKDAAACIKTTVEDGFEAVELLWGDLMGAAATCIRGMLVASPGHDLVSADFSSIEARVNAWIAGEESVLTAFREKQDLYKVAASQMFNKPVSEVTKQERQIGKTVELACIAEGQLVLTDSGLVPIENITTEHLLWDGEEFVSHGGVIYRGEKPVFTYEGLTATPDHIVWVRHSGQSRQIRFGLAATSGSHLVQSGAGGNPVRVGGDNISGAQVHKGLEFGVRTGSVYELWQDEMVVLVESYAGKEQRLPKMLQPSAHTEVVGPQDNRHAATVCEPKRCRMGKLRQKGHTLRVCRHTGSWAVDNGEPWPTQRQGTGSHRQRWALCSWKSAVCHPSAECCEPKVLGCHLRRLRVGGKLQPIRVPQDLSVFQRGAIKRTDSGKGQIGCEGEAQKLERHTGAFRFSGLHRVYDILNSGPRNRFTVSGVLVHNCGYQGGIGAYTAMAKNYGIDLEALPQFILPLAQEEMLDRAKGTAATYLKKNPGAMSAQAAVACDIIKQLWRQKRPNIVALWRGLEEASLLAVKNPGRAYRYRNIVYKSDEVFLRCKLPSGRYLHYYNPGLQMKETPWGEPKEVVTFYGVDSVTRKFVKSHIYGGGCCENAVQAASRDLMAEAMLRCEAAGYPVVLSVHDELVADVPVGRGSVKEFEALMSEVPHWAKGLPVSAEGWREKRYRK